VTRPWDELVCPECGTLNGVVLEGEGLYITKICEVCGKEVKFVRDPCVTASFELLSRYARICGMALAKAHTRSGDAVIIAGYLGKSEVFDKSLASFAQQYAKQNMMDYEALLEAVNIGRIEADEEKSGAIRSR
jgi:hypothetical protein